MLQLFISFFLLISSSLFAQEQLLALTKIKLKPGQVYKFTMPSESEDVSVGFCGTDEVGVVKSSKTKSFYFAFSYFTKVGMNFTCGFKIKNEKKSFFEIEIIDGGFKEEILTVNKETVKLNKKALKRVAEDRKILDKVYQSSHSESYFLENFQAPMESVVTSLYGGKRIYNDHKKSQHLGIDYRAKIGEGVRASNKGKILLAKDLFFTGDTVIVDHGLSIFSVYAHLSKILVKEGDLVEKNQVIALSGATGRVSGPHLHWGIKMNQVWVDGLSLLEAQ